MSEVPQDALQRLIHERMRELRRSYGDVARRGGLSRSTVHYLATHGRSGRLPNPSTLERLALGLDLPLSVVRAAAASAAGFVLDSQAGDDPEIDVLVASLVRLSPADRQHVAALVRSMLAAAKPVS
jgi:transcriptional regulator with XRE-family HTH domain